MKRKQLGLEENAVNSWIVPRLLPFWCYFNVAHPMELSTLTQAVLRSVGSSASGLPWWCIGDAQWQVLGCNHTKIQNHRYFQNRSWHMLRPCQFQENAKNLGKSLEAPDTEHFHHCWGSWPWRKRRLKQNISTDLTSLETRTYSCLHPRPPEGLHVWPQNICTYFRCNSIYVLHLIICIVLYACVCIWPMCIWQCCAMYANTRIPMIQSYVRL